MLVDDASFMTPVGPFCPFRSDACALNGKVDSSMGSLTDKSTSFMADMARFQLEAQMGTMPDPDRVRNVANGLSEAHSQWDTLMQRMRLSGDFQSMEYYKMTEAHLKTQGQSLEAIGMAMRWQVDTMRAFADGRPPPNPPVGLDLEAMAKQAQQGSGGGMASALGGAPAIDAPPFEQGGAAFDSPVVKEEYEKLCRDHAGLIRMGASYASFEPNSRNLAYQKNDRLRLSCASTAPGVTPSLYRIRFKVLPILCTVVRSSAQNISDSEHIKGKAI